ncbi:hypothetical protein AAVH_35753 [Aphelenchoides avenae]|nr:hypothetical protein AAVH_35753 [Aphelenchus avenae]
MQRPYIHHGALQHDAVFVSEAVLLRYLQGAGRQREDRLFRVHTSSARHMHRPRGVGVGIDVKMLPNGRHLVGVGTSNKLYGHVRRVWNCNKSADLLDGGGRMPLHWKRPEDGSVCIHSVRLPARFLQHRLPAEVRRRQNAMRCDESASTRLCSTGRLLSDGRRLGTVVGVERVYNKVRFVLPGDEDAEVCFDAIRMSVRKQRYGRGAEEVLQQDALHLSRGLLLYAVHSQIH